MKAFHSERCVLIVDLKNDLIKSVLNQGKYFVISHFIRLLCPSNVTELDKEYIKLLTWPLLKYFLSLIGLFQFFMNDLHQDLFGPHVDISSEQPLNSSTLELNFRSFVTD